jgi:thiamine-phosphate pyrophosphorylase
MNPIYGLYAITQDNLPTDTLLAGVDAILQGGCKLVQYRNKQQCRDRMLQEVRELLALCHRYGATLLINDDVELAVTAGAHGVHLGQEDMPIQQARDILGPQAIIGITCHNSIALAEEAQLAGADYVAFGRFFPSDTKHSAPPAELTVLLVAKQRLNIPVVAIGGITLDNAPAVLSAGADILAVVGDLFNAPDITARSQSYSDLFTHYTPQGINR